MILVVIDLKSLAKEWDNFIVNHFMAVCVWVFFSWKQVLTDSIGFKLNLGWFDEFV